MIPNGTKVKWNYRSTTAVGTVQSVESMGNSEADTRYKVRPAERKYHEGEPEIVIHTGSNLVRVSDEEYENHIANVAKAHRS